MFLLPQGGAQEALPASAISEAEIEYCSVLDATFSLKKAHPSMFFSRPFCWASFHAWRGLSDYQSLTECHFQYKKTPFEHLFHQL